MSRTVNKVGSKSPYLLSNHYQIYIENVLNPKSGTTPTYSVKEVTTAAQSGEVGGVIRITLENAKGKFKSGDIVRVSDEQGLFNGYDFGISQVTESSSDDEVTLVAGSATHPFVLDYGVAFTKSFADSGTKPSAYKVEFIQPENIKEIEQEAPTSEDMDVTTLKNNSEVLVPVGKKFGTIKIKSFETLEDDLLNIFKYANAKNLPLLVVAKHTETVTSKNKTARKIVLASCFVSKIPGLITAKLKSLSELDFELSCSDQYEFFADETTN